MINATTVRCSCVLLLVILSAAPAQLPLRFRENVNISAGVSAGVADRAGDIDGDGVVDVILGAPLAVLPFANRGGRVRVFSGADGSTLLTLDGSVSFEWFGAAVAGMGDVDADGIADFAIGVPGEGTFSFPMPGRVDVVSGSDGSVIYSLYGSQALDRFGLRLAGGMDVDGDGVADLVVGIPGWDGPLGPDYGAVEVHSGVDGALLYCWQGSAQEDRFGDTMDFAGDVDGDGIPDVVVGAMLSDVNGLNSGQVKVFSGADGSTIRTLDGPAAHYELGSAVARAGDIDSDGHCDLVLGGAGLPISFFARTGYVIVVSGADGSILYSVQPSSPWTNFGRRAAGAGDINGDGVDDILILDPDQVPGTPLSFLAISGQDLGVLRSFSTPMISAGVPRLTFHGVGDLEGDGIDDLVAVYPDPFPSGGGAGTATIGVSVLSATGRHVSGVDTAAASQVLSLDWLGGAPPAVGELSCTGAPPSSPGLLVVSASEASTTFNGVPLLVGILPTESFGIPFTFDAQGALTVSLDLRIPLLAEQNLFMQVFGTDVSDPSLATTSNGLDLLFTR